MAGNAVSSPTCLTARAQLTRESEACRRQGQLPAHWRCRERTWIRWRGGAAGGEESEDEAFTQPSPEAKETDIVDWSGDDSSAENVANEEEDATSDDAASDDEEASPAASTEDGDEDEDAEEDDDVETFVDISDDNNGDDEDNADDADGNTEKEREPTDDFEPTSPAKGRGKGAPAAERASIAAAVSGPSPHALLHMVKQMGMTAAAMALVRRLKPEVPACVRTARVIYFAYLTVYHTCCMYMRVRVWRLNDTSEVDIPPPAFLPRLLKTAGAAATGVTADTDGVNGMAAGGGGLPPGLEQMAERMMTRKTTAKKYDMDRIDAMRLSQSMGSIFMAFLHLR
ncbi:unnamed protein product [Phaeothamnion confervicola]